MCLHINKNQKIRLILDEGIEGTSRVNELSNKFKQMVYEILSMFNNV